MSDYATPPLFEVKEGGEPIEPYLTLSNEELLKRFKSSLAQIGLTAPELSDPTIIDAALQEYVNVHINSDKDAEDRPPYGIAIVNGKELGETYSMAGIVAFLYMTRNVLEGFEPKQEHMEPLTTALYSMLAYTSNRIETWVREEV